MKNKITIPEPVKKFTRNLLAALLLVSFSYLIILTLKATGTEAIIKTLRILLEQLSTLGTIQMIIFSLIISLVFIAINSLIRIHKIYFQLLFNRNHTK